MELVLYVLFFFPGILALVIAGWGYGYESMRLREVSVNSPAGVPIWPLKMMIPVGASADALQGFAEVAALRAVPARRRSGRRVCTTSRNSKIRFCRAGRGQAQRRRCARSEAR